MNEERIKELFANEEFVNDLFASESYEEAQKKLADKDVEVTVDELKKCMNLLKKSQNGELTDEELEDVAGGSIVAGIITVLSIACVGTVAGVAFSSAKKRC